MKTPEGDRIRDILSCHIGRSQAIHAPEIAIELGWKPSAERVVRDIISSESVLWSMRPYEMLVCSAPGSDGGFFVATDYNEAFQFDSWLTEMIEKWTDRRASFREACRRLGIRFMPREEAAA